MKDKNSDVSIPHITVTRRRPTAKGFMGLIPVKPTHRAAPPGTGGVWPSAPVDHFISGDTWDENNWSSKDIGFARTLGVTKSKSQRMAKRFRK